MGWRKVHSSDGRRKGVTLNQRDEDMRLFLWNTKSPCPLEEKGPPKKSRENIVAAVDDIKKSGIAPALFSWPVQRIGV